MTLEKNLWELSNKMRGRLSNEEILILPITLTSISYNQKYKLHEIVTPGDSITNSILSEVKKLPISELSKKLLTEKLNAIFEILPLSVVVDLSFNFAKLLEVYEEIQIIDAIISKLLNLKTTSFLNAPDELIEIIRNYFNMSAESTLYSGVTGTGSEVTKLIDNQNDISFYGQDFATELFMLAEIRFMFSSFKYEMKLGDVLKEPLYIEDNQLKQFDYVFNAPRFGLRLDDIAMKEIKEDRYHRFTYFGKPSRSNSDLGYVICGLQQLKDTGKGAFILPSSALTRSGADSKIRDRFLQADIIDVIVELPANLFAPVTGISTVLIFFNKNKDPNAKGNIQFINATKFDKEQDRMKTTLSEEGVINILNSIKNRNDITNISKVISIQDIKGTELLPSKYVFDTKVELENYGPVEIDLEAFEQLDKVELSNIAEIYRGYNALPKDQTEDGNYAIIKIADVEDGEINYSKLTKYQLGGRTKVEKYRLEKGDVILSVRGHQLKVAVFESDRDDVLLSQNFVGIRLSKEYEPYFVKLYLESPTMQFILRSKLTETTVMNLPIKEVETIQIPKIPLEEQQRIVATYREKASDLKDQIAQLQQALDSVKLKSFETMGIGNTFIILE